jgi:HAD superfamily hydrolase (TIGR01549 family)
MPKVSKMKKIIFDLDGTLLFLSGTWENIYQDFIDTYNLNTTPKELFQTIGTFEKDNSNIIVTKEILCDYINSKINISITVEMLNDLDERYNNIPLLDTERVYTVLEYLSSKYELITYTNWFTEDQVFRLRKYNLDKFFTKSYGWDIVESKPSKDGLEKIIEGNKSDYIIIGDTIKTDMEVADSIGIKTIFYNRKNIEQDKYTEIKDIEELVSIL